MPKIKHKGLELDQVGCKVCGNGECWKIYTDHNIFAAKCKCGNTVEIPTNDLDNSPELPVI